MLIVNKFSYYRHGWNMKRSCNEDKCPHLGAPHAECYCSRMNSQMIEKVIKFCGGNFRECDIYQNYHNQEIQHASHA